MFETPILLIIFNRPEVTQQVFEEIKKQKPKFLFIAADGPRIHIEEDIDKCSKTRELVLKGIDWDCEVKTQFRNVNLGCGKGVSSAIDWFFENVDKGIILEDDCLPHPSFFGYCESLLEKYAENQKVFGISGANLHTGVKKNESSYFYSNYIFVWGWATWKRAWGHYDYEMKDYEKFVTNKFFRRIDKRNAFQEYWKSKFEMVSKKQIDTWDYQWLFAIWKNKGVVVVPSINLISNIGFNSSATNTKSPRPYSNLETFEIGSLKHPKKISVNNRADRNFSFYVFRINYKKISYKGFWLRLKNLILIKD